MFKVEEKRLHIFFYVVFLLSIVLFSYFRLRPIQFQTVPYTYDQGRDFLKAAQIIREKHLTFIGPTTGIMGVFHGAWWYYFLLVPYLLFQGNPVGFYYAIFFLQLIAAVLFALFLKKEFGYNISLIFFLIVSVSPYFAQTAYFPSNNFLTPPLVLLFCFSVFRLLKTKAPLYGLLTGLSLGFILETELSFGIFLIPAFFVTMLLFKRSRETVLTKIILFLTILGFGIPSIPRVLFEVKNHFLQTNALVNFLKNPTTTNVVSLSGAFHDRINLFATYLKEIFFDRSAFLAIVFIIPVIAGLIIMFKKLKQDDRLGISVFAILIFLVFLLTVLSHNNFFWGNYLEGIQYLFLFIILFSLYAVRKWNLSPYLNYSFLVIAAALNLFLLYKVMIDTTPPPAVGLRADMQTVQSYYRFAKNNSCLEIYTPPVVPYTYNYLFQYYETHGKPYPKEDRAKGLCWYIIDDDSNKERLARWRKDHIPEKAVLLETHRMENKTTIELWQRHP